MNESLNIDNQLPYNPSDVDIRQQTFSIFQIMNMITHGEIELWREADYQRKSNQWKDEQKSRLLESLIMRIPLPIFYFDGSEHPWKIIDGLHRLTSLYTFMRGASFQLVNLEYLKDLEGKTFSDLPFKYKRAIEESTIEAYVINPGTPDKVKLNIFQRINTGGSTLSRQEIRNAYYRGLPVEFIDELSGDLFFLNATYGKISTSKMKDKEAVLRFFTFFKYLEQYNPPMDKFLDFSMESISTIKKNELEEIKDRFKNSMSTCQTLFDENVFQILNMNGEKQSSSINIALFESWSVNVAKLEEIERENLIRQKNRLIKNFISKLQDIEFHKSISSSTSSKKAVFTRFETIKNLIKNILNAH
jgi:hypothetical protein